MGAQNGCASACSQIAASADRARCAAAAVIHAIVQNWHLDLLTRVVRRVREKEITVDVVIAFD
eukprot:1433996-Rhodomonas_salina.1